MEKRNNIILQARSTGKWASMQRLMDEIFKKNPMARVMIAKSDGQHEVIEGATFEEVTTTNHGIEQNDTPLLGSGEPH